MKKKELKKTRKNSQGPINFLFESRILKHLLRASFPYLKGPIKENVAEHSFYVILFAWILANLEKADENKAIKIALVHDLVEARRGERNLINKFYTKGTNDPKIMEEIVNDHHLKGLKLSQLFKEFLEKKTLEAKIVRDADILSGMLLEKECLDLGNKKAEKWLKISLKRLKTNSGKKLGRTLIRTDSDSWWLKITEKYLPITEFL